jgi:uncharacterized membrane protein
MRLSRPKNGEIVAGVSAAALFASTFLHWFGIELVNNTNLLFYVHGIRPGENAWEALDYTPVIISITVIAIFCTLILRSLAYGFKLLAAADLITGSLGLVSALLILSHIFNPPSFGTQNLVTSEGVLRPPIFLALVAAFGVAVGCLWSVFESQKTRHPVLKDVTLRGARLP